MMTLVRLQTKQIVDWPTFHDTFAETFGFPSFYGRNMNAWIDCMSWLDDPSSGMTSVHAPKGGIVVLQLEDVDSFADRCLAQFQAIIDGTAFVNWRRIESGEPAVLALSYYKVS